MVEKSLEEKIEFLRLRSKVVTEDLLRVDNVNYLKEEVLVKISELRGAAFGLKQEVNSDGTESLITAFGGLDAAIVTLDFSYDLQKEILEQRQQEYESDEFHDELEFDIDNVKMFSAADVSLKPGGSWQGIFKAIIPKSRPIMSYFLLGTLLSVFASSAIASVRGYLETKKPVEVVVQDKKTLPEICRRVLLSHSTTQTKNGAMVQTKLNSENRSVGRIVSECFREQDYFDMTRVILPRGIGAVNVPISSFRTINNDKQERVVSLYPPIKGKYDIQTHQTDMLSRRQDGFLVRSKVNSTMVVSDQGNDVGVYSVMPGVIVEAGINHPEKGNYVVVESPWNKDNKARLTYLFLDGLSQKLDDFLRKKIRKQKVKFKKGDEQPILPYLYRGDSVGTVSYNMAVGAPVVKIISEIVSNKGEVKISDLSAFLPLNPPEMRIKYGTKKEQMKAELKPQMEFVQRITNIGVAFQNRLIKNESRWNQEAVSSIGASGLCQLTKVGLWASNEYYKSLKLKYSNGSNRERQMLQQVNEVLADWNIDNAYANWGLVVKDPKVNHLAGFFHLAHLRDKKYDGDLLMALSAYNAGIGRVGNAKKCAAKCSGNYLEVMGCELSEKSRVKLIKGHWAYLERISGQRIPVDKAKYLQPANRCYFDEKK